VEKGICEVDRSHFLLIISVHNVLHWHSILVVGSTVSAQHCGCINIINMNSSSKDNSNNSIIEKNYQSATEGSGAMNADDIDNAILPSKQEFIDDNNIEECNLSERDDSPPDEEFVVLTNQDGVHHISHHGQGLSCSLPNDTFSFIFISKVFSIPFLILR
jgi:hypothetical protein